MYTGLNPITLAKLEQFRRRRRRLILLRGICSAVVSFLVLMSLVALADWLWILSDSLRWTLSGIAYAGVVLVAWLTCLRAMIRIPSHRELAMRMEAAEPGLRENLLAAVELSTDGSSEVHDSPVFRWLVQDRVARQIESVRVGSLLPPRLVRPWLLTAALVLAICGTLLYQSDLPYRQLMTRAVLPGANIARVSQIQVTILEPTPHSLTIPEDDTVAIVVETAGGRVDEVTLETFTESKGVVRQAMNPRSSSQFAVNLTVAREPVDYRILAGDAVTQKYTIRSQPRPKVQAFYKNFRYPEYAGLEDRKVTEPHGDLVELEGTEADLTLQLDQEVSKAEIRLERPGSDEIETVELVPDGPRQLRITLPITASGIYKVHLVGKETGFENTFSPKYEIRPQPDLIPRVGFVGQQETTQLVPPNDILPLEGLAEDDLPLVGLEQHVSVNGQEWEKVPLEVEAARRVTTSWQWDLLKLKLKSGDQITTKLVATDRKGNTGESIPLHLVVAPPDFDPQRHAVMQWKAAVYDKLAELATTIEQHRTAAKDLLKPLVEKDQMPEIQQADRAALLDLAGKIREEADKAFKILVEILPKMPKGADAYELELATRVIARIRHEYTHGPETWLDAVAQDEDAKQAKEDLQRVIKSFDQSAEDAKRLAERYRDLLGHNILAGIAIDLDALLRQQRRLLAPAVAQSWERLLRQETVALNQIRNLERLIRDNLARLPSSAEGGVRNYLDWIAAHRERLQSVMESQDQADALRRAAESLMRELEGRQNAVALDGRLPTSILEARKELDQRAGSLFAPMEQLARAASEVGRYTAQATQSGDSTESKRLLASAQRAAAELNKLQIPSTAQLTDRRSATQSRPDPDSQYVSDVGLTRRALTALMDRYGSESPAESEVPAILAKIAPAYRILESGHEVVHIRTCLDHLVSRERWDSQQIASRLDHPRQWDAVHNGLELAARKLKEAAYPGEIVSKLDGLRWCPPAQDVARKINVRRYRPEPLVGAAHELAELETELDKVIEEMQPIMAEARALIARYVPTIPEMARNAAEELRQMEEQTADLAENAAKPEDTVPKMEQLQQQQHEINQRLEDLAEALVEDANAQDPLTEEGRERARDADDAMAMVQQPAARMNQAIERAEAAAQPEQRARDLAQAAEQEEKTADALDTVARHYERLASGEDIAETRQALREAEKEMDIAQKLDEQYREAQRLGEMAAKDPQQLLAELEAELRKNPLMQEALSDISRDALQQAKNTLQDSAEREIQMERLVENTDREFQAKKKALLEAAREIAQEASDLGRTLVAQADSAAASAKAQQAREQLQQAQRELAEAAAKPRNVGEDRVLEEVVGAAREMAEALAEASEDLAESRDTAAKARDEKIHEKEEQRAASQRELEAAAKRFQEQRVREAKEKARNRTQVQKRAEQQVKSTENTLRNAENQFVQAHHALQRKPDNESARRARDEADRKRQAAQAAVDQAKKELESAAQKAQQAEQAAKQLEQAKLEPLSAANPAAQLAHRFAQEATAVAEDLTRRAKELAAEPPWSKELDPDQGQLASMAAQQENVGQEVTQAAEDVARAGRHEERLGKPAVAAQLGEAAKGVKEVAKEEVSTAQQKLAEAAAQAMPSQRDPGESQRALAARESVEQAEEALQGQAKALEEMLNPSDAQLAAAAEDAQSDAGEPSQAETGAPSPSRPSPAEMAQGQFLARTLDELDRALSAAQQAAEQPAAPQPQLSSLAQAAQAQAARMNQARLENLMPAQNQPSLEHALQSAQGAALTDMSAPGSALMPVNRVEDADWGKLRGQSAEDLTEGRRESISADYRKQVETYFRVIGERARKKP